MRLLLLIAVTLLLAGCATVSSEEVASAHFSPLPPNYQQTIKNFTASQLKDPYTAVYQFGTPRRGFNQDGFLNGGKKHYGYIVPVGINARNSFGGYTGEEQHYFFLAEGRVGDCTAVMGQMAKFID